MSGDLPAIISEALTVAAIILIPTVLIIFFA